MYVICVKKYFHQIHHFVLINLTALLVTKKQNSKCCLCEKVFTSERSLEIHSNLVHVSSDLSEIRRQKMVDAKKNSSIRRTSKAEDEFFNCVSRIFPDAIRHFLILDHSHVYDVYIPSANTIIEFDGDFGMVTKSCLN